MPEQETTVTREKLYRIVDEDGDDLFVQAETYSQAAERFKELVRIENGEDCEDTIQSIMHVGYLLSRRRV